MRSEMMTVTPEMAETWLGMNVGNRKIRHSQVATLMTALKRGEWVETHQGIAFDTSGVLVDGQHRLIAIRDSGVSAKLMVNFGVDPKAFMAIDIGANRSFSDVLKIDRRVAEPLRLAATIVFSHRGKPSPRELEEVGKIGLQEELENLISECGTTRKFFSCAAIKLAAALSVLTGAQRQYVHGQYRALVNFDVDAMSEYSKTFAKQVVDGKFRSIDQYEILARGMLLFDQKRSEMKRMMVSKTDVSETIENVRFMLKFMMDEPVKAASLTPAKRYKVMNARQPTSQPR